MKLGSLSVYHCLPAPLRSVVASVRGYQLRRVRYGPDTEGLVEEALAREHWSTTRRKNWVQEQLVRTLHHAATQVPYYREQWASRRRHGDRSSWEDIRNWPILEKEPLRANPLAFLADGQEPARLPCEHTSGSTGKPVSLWLAPQAVRAWYALTEARWRRWYGVSRADRWAIVGGQSVVAVERRSPPFWVWNAPMRQLYMSCYHLAPDLIPSYLDALTYYRVRYLWGYTSSLYLIAQEAIRLGWQVPDLAAVITNAEPLHQYQRQTMAAAFRCPVHETYGSAEQVVGASECEAGRLHLWPEAGWIEIEQHAQSSDGSSRGDLLCTGFLNSAMPLVRYRIGDSGRLLEGDASCPCGRTLPILASLDGRADDLIYTADGRPIWGLTPEMYAPPEAVCEAQLIQEKLDLLRVRYVPALHFGPAAADAMVSELRARFGQVEIALEPVAGIPRGANGKFQAVICNLSASEKAQCVKQPAQHADEVCSN